MTAADITDMKSAEFEIRESEARLEEATRIAQLGTGPSASPPDPMPVVVISDRGQQFGMIVDAFLIPGWIRIQNSLLAMQLGGR